MPFLKQKTLLFPPANLMRFLTQEQTDSSHRALIGTFWFTWNVAVWNQTGPKGKCKNSSTDLDEGKLTVDVKTP